jgi:myo-inositol-1(or 4)-monophosphatase
MSAELASLQEILRSAALTVDLARAQFQSELKPDGSLVTNADRAVEIHLREQLGQLVPGAAIWGEEFGHEAPNEVGQWQIDPIDGTTNFAYGSPLWGISVSLYRNGRMDLGGIFLPDLGEMYLAGFGLGATLNGLPLPMIAPGAIRPEDPISVCDHVTEEFGREWFHGKSRCAGAFVIDGTFTSTGRYRALIGLRERLYDVGASLVLFGEVGLEISYADGSEFDLNPLLAGSRIECPWIAAPVNDGIRGQLPDSRRR